MSFRDRIIELRRVRAGDLVPNPANWRDHPAEQRTALRALMTEVGVADALIGRDTPDGVQLIDGHARRDLDPEQVMPVLIVDLDDREADLLLASLDPLAAMATTNDQALRELLGRIDPADDIRAALEAAHDVRLVEFLAGTGNEPPVPEGGGPRCCRADHAAGGPVDHG